MEDILNELGFVELKCYGMLKPTWVRHKETKDKYTGKTTLELQNLSSYEKDEAYR
jgi:hypothetical protein